jgi:hypothetical protein
MMCGALKRRLVGEGYVVATKGVRQFIYQYNGQGKSQEVEEDLSGRIETPSIGSVITRNGKEWRVFHVIAPVSLIGTVPVIRVFLSDNTWIKGRPPFSIRTAS